MWRWFQAFMGAAVTAVWLARAFTSIGSAAQAPPGFNGWRIPHGAAAELNPAPVGAEALAKGQRLFKAKCYSCHGSDGSGHGPEAEPSHPPGDLTDGRAAARNPDGVLFYKIWNGRAKPRMPAMKLDLSRDEVWMLVAYVKTLRK